MKTLFPEIEPYQVHALTVDSGHTIYVEESGNPKGKPIIFLHGGPGGGTGPKQRRFLILNITVLFCLINVVVEKVPLMVKL